MSYQMFNNQNFRKAVANFPTGVSVVSVRASDGSFIGVTANSFSSVSLVPPLVSVSLNRSLRSFQHFVDASHFGINILAADQHHISSTFARPGSDKWSWVKSFVGPAGSPFIQPNIATFECETYAQYEGGDHVIFVGRVMHFEIDENADPLVFFRSSYRRLSDEVLAVTDSIQNGPDSMAEAKS
jgi:3-hydroxy-9,10-secoandrosta-1,3,5(10)-triene-9,17-dione monooxygenase reductase component